MYSILIQNQKTMESFHQYYPIFMEAISEGRMGVCQWLESGTSIETAVPELYDMTNDKDEWRAIIVRVEDEAPMQAWPTFPHNPYDFIENANSDCAVCESDIPLIRLTHLLGGIPAPVLHFECEQIREENKAPRMIYRPTVDHAEEALYKELCEKYHFEGKAPSEIVLVSLRTKQDLRVESVRKAWQLGKETDSSLFWKRNSYPSLCRFTFFEMERQGPVQRTADLFKVWMGVMLMATNDIDPSTLQAYKLHRLDVEFDRKVMTATLQNSINRSISARQCIAKSIQRELEQKINEERVLPDYRLEAPVVLKLPPLSDFLANRGAFKLTAKSSTSDLEQWNGMRASAEKSLASLNTCAERALDQTAERVRRYCLYTEPEILPLDQYQKEDMTTELDGLYHAVFDLRSELPCDERSDNKRLRELAGEVKEKLLMRLTRRSACAIYGLAALAFLLTFIPAVIFSHKYHWGTPGTLALAALLGLVLLSLTELISLWLQKRELDHSIRSFNSFVNAVVTRVADNATAFSRYMTGIASHIHGSSYLSLLKRKAFLRDEADYYKQNHITALNSYLVDLKNWSVAFHLPVSFEAVDVDEDIVIDTDVSPSANPLYTFESKAGYTVPVNTAGDTIDAPFGFVKRLKISREELYDD